MMWIKTSEKLPKAREHVIARQKCNCGHIAIIGFYVTKFLESCYHDDICDCEYDEKTDYKYWAEGWYEAIHNWDEYSSVAVLSEITHWQPLPGVPK